MEKMRKNRISDFKSSIKRQSSFLIDSKYIKVIDDIPLDKVIKKNNWVDYKDIIWTR